jgi:uncharacterized membrane protein YedE/YeeE
MEHFSPISASIGGALIGLSAALLWLGNGRIAGISGIFGQLLPPARTVIWRLVFLAALVGGTFLAAALFPALGNAPQLAVPPSWFGSGAPGWTAVWIGASGLLTGFGTKIGNGCTSGHGICGLARLSTRSFVAVGVFFVVAIATVTITGIV